MLLSAISLHIRACKARCSIYRRTSSWRPSRRGRAVAGVSLHRRQCVRCSVPEGADAYLFRHLLHDYDDADCAQDADQRAPPHETRVTGAGAEKTVPTDDTPGPGRWLDLHIMLLTGGPQAPRAGVSGAVREGGLKLNRVLPTAHPAVEVIEAVAADTTGLRRCSFR